MEGFQNIWLWLDTKNLIHVLNKQNGTLWQLHNLYSDDFDLGSETKGLEMMSHT